MAETIWQVMRTERCERIGEVVTLEVCRVYAAEFLPDQPPHVVGRRCSQAMACNQCTQSMGKSAFHPLKISLNAAILR